MRAILILLCALILPSGEALAAAPKRFSATGCVRLVGKCLVLRSKRGDYFLLGRNLQAAVGKEVKVKGKVRIGAEYACPTRLIIEGNVRVSSWKVTRRSCRSF